MMRPTDSERIQLIAVLRVLDIKQDTVADILQLRKATVVETEKWLRDEDYQTVSDVLNDEILKATIQRELPNLAADEPNILVKAGFVNQATILVHYKRKIPEANLEVRLRHNQNEIAQVAQNHLDEKLAQQKDDIAKIIEKSSKMTKRTIKHVSGDDLKTELRWSKTKHLDSLLEDSQKLRRRIVNPNLRMKVFYEQEKSTWSYQGFDWRLAPYYWFSIVVPLFEFADRWIPNFDNLMLHLANSSFLKHYEEFKDETIELAVKINEFADSQIEGNPSWYEKWDKFTEYLDIFFVDGRQFKPDSIPSHDVVQQLIDDFSDLGNFFSETEIKLKEYYPDLDKKCEMLEALLQQVYDDLDKNQIALDINNSECPQCPDKKLQR